MCEQDTGVLLVRLFFFRSPPLVVTKTKVIIWPLTSRKGQQFFDNSVVISSINFWVTSVIQEFFENFRNKVRKDLGSAFYKQQRFFVSIRSWNYSITAAHSGDRG